MGAAPLTRLAAVEERRPDEPLGGVLEVGALVDDRGRLAAKLEHARRQVLRRLLQDDLADEARAGEANLVKALVEQGVGDGTVALRDFEALGVEVLLHQP